MREKVKFWYDFKIEMFKMEEYRNTTARSKGYVTSHTNTR